MTETALIPGNVRICATGVVFRVARRAHMGHPEDMPAPYRLHYAPDNASLVVRLALEEMGQPYETVLVDRTRREQAGEAYRRLNPNGLIPVLETPQGPIFETAAILLWLGDTHGQLVPNARSDDRAPFLKWLFFASNTLHADLRLLFYPEQHVGQAHRAALQDGARGRLLRHLEILETAASAGNAWLCGPRPSALDLYLACQLRWMAIYPAGSETIWFELDRYPTLYDMCARLEARPSVQAAVLAEGLGARPFTAAAFPQPPEGSAI